MIGVPEGSDIEVQIGLESVLDGVYVSGAARTRAAGDCVRCLDPLEQEVVAAIQELYLYDPPQRAADDPDELPGVDGDWIDLEPALRDAVVTALPFQPICTADCPGLCSRCGTRLRDDREHSHDEVDPRWEALREIIPQPTRPTPPTSGSPDKES